MPGPDKQALRVEVAVAAPLWKALTYRVPAELAPMVRPLARLAVPLRGRTALGFALGLPETGPVEGLAAVRDVLEPAGEPQLLPPEMLGFHRRASAHYQTPLGQALAWSLPAGLGSIKPSGGATDLGRASVEIAHYIPGNNGPLPRVGTQAAQILERLRLEGEVPLPELRQQFSQAARLVRRLESQGWLRINHRAAFKDVLGRPIMAEPEPETLSQDQHAALAAIIPALEQRRFESFLLYGVTGSGKTEVYMAGAKRALEQGLSALILVPEIGLALRLQGLVARRFGAEQAAVLHSGLSPSTRRGQWRAISSGGPKVVVGARSAVFAPLRGLGLICVDEEQDEAYKQDDRFRYHGRDLALLRGQEQGCPVVLGTATPAVTTLERARSGALRLLEMPRRIGGAVLPDTEVVDLRSAGRLTGGFLSPRLHQALRQEVGQGRQAIVFLNRRGFAPALLCPACGKTVGCPACSVSLTLHRAANRLTCHTCGHNRPLPGKCPNCGADGDQMRPLGLGTEAVADKLAELEPQWRITRLDRDTASSPAKLAQVLRDVADHKVDVIVGTQMITKGHHFPRINLVGVLLADQALSLPDFRAAERAYTVLTQAAGRAGRGQTKGRVIVQTYDPLHHAIQAAASHRPDLFYEMEIAERRLLGYPPFMRLMLLRLEGAAFQAVERAAAGLAEKLAVELPRISPEAQVLGPAPAPMSKAQGRFRWQIILKTPTASQGSRLLQLGLHRLGGMPPGVRLIVDVDPLNLI